MTSTATFSSTSDRKDAALSLIEQTLSQSQAEGALVRLRLGSESLSRFSENQIVQNIHRDEIQLEITSMFGRRSASASTTDLDPEAIAATLRRSEALARIAPEDPEWMPLVPPPTYEARSPAFDPKTASVSPIERGELVQQVCAACRQAGVEGAGTLSTATQTFAIGNSLGLRGCDAETEADFSITARRDDGSNWNQQTAWGIDQLPITDITTTAIANALASRRPRDIQPGTYPVVFHAAAFATLLNWTVWNLDARAADEGRSFMSRRDAAGNPTGNRVGETMFSPLVTIRRDPAHPWLQTGRFFSDGLPNSPLDIVREGIPQTLSYSRYWAAQQNQQPTGAFAAIAMPGSDRRLEDLIAQTERGILVSRAWYVRYVNPRTLEVTGMTRDGTFWIEGGRIAHPIKNLRFNHELPHLLRDIDILGAPQRLGDCIAPSVRVQAFKFTSVTDSV